MIRTAILGAGRAAAAWCDAITASGLGQVVRVLARGEGADALAVRYGARPARHADEIFGGPAGGAAAGGGPGADGVQAVVIASPTDTHAGYLRRGREAGLHVMVEMPAARDAAGPDGLDGAAIEAAALVAAGKAAAAFLPLRFAPEWTHLRNAAAAGTLGTIGVVRLQMLAPYRPGHGAWAADFARSGGATLALLPHLLDFATGAFGPILRLNAERAPAGPGGPGDLSRDHVLAIGRFESGALLHLSAGWTEAPGAPTTTAYEVAGSSGILDYDSRRAARLTLTPVAPGAGPAYGENPMDSTPIRRAAADFLRAAATGGPVASPLADGLAATAAAMALLKP